MGTQEGIHRISLQSMPNRVVRGVEQSINQRFLKDYMRTYNTSVHSGTGATPLERYQQTRSAIRMPKSRQWLEECFLNRITRKVGKDSTVSIDRVSYDVPMQFISSKVAIHFLPDDMSSAFILYEGGALPHPAHGQERELQDEAQ